MRYFALAALLVLAACDKSAPVAPTTTDDAIAAAERKAISDTDAAMAEARTAQAAGTNGQDDRFPR